MLASCLASEESVDHLLLNCKVAQAVWTSVLVWFDCSWTLSCSLHHLFEAWEMWLGSARRENYVEISLRLYGSYGKKGMQDVLKESLHRSTLYVIKSSSSWPLGCPSSIPFMVFPWILFFTNGRR